jgi:hypothetical protein
MSKAPSPYLICDAWLAQRELKVSPFFAARLMPSNVGAARQQDAQAVSNNWPAKNGNNTFQNRRTGFVQKDKLRLVSTRLRCLNRTTRS